MPGGDSTLDDELVKACRYRRHFSPKSRRASKRTSVAHVLNVLQYERCDAPVDDEGGAGGMLCGHYSFFSLGFSDRGD